MSFNHITAFYDKNLFKKDYSISSYNSLIKNIKIDKLFLSKIIYEKNATQLLYKKKQNLEIDHNRYISEHNDKLILFSVGDDSKITLLWYNEYGTKKHISIYNGKAIIIDLYSSLYHNIMIQENENVYHAILCDFQYFNIQYFFKKHNEKPFDLNSIYTVI